jgi:hypothetical protein
MFAPAKRTVKLFPVSILSNSKCRRDKCRYKVAD